MTVQSLGIVDCHGIDATKFLQGQLSADISALSDNQGTLACYLNLKGRVVALMFVIKKPDGYWLILPNDLIPTLIKRLQKFIVFSKASLTDISNEYCVKGIIGSPSTRLAGDIEENIIYLSPEHGIELHIEQHAGPVALSDTFLLALMKAHIPWIGLAQSEQFLPHYINLVALNAVSFKKGCYVGQEIVARMQYKGHANKSLSVIESYDDISADIVNEITINDQRFVLVSR